MLVININGRAEIKMNAQSRRLKEHFSGRHDSVAAMLTFHQHWVAAHNNVSVLL